MGHVSADLLVVRAPRHDETYFEYLDSFGLLDQGFAFRELVRPHNPHREGPPPALWRRMPATLALVNELRERMLCHGASGLLVHAAFRPEGGQPDSQHKHNGALDVDLIASDVERAPHLPALFARTAAELWREHRDLKAGVGTYAAEGHETTLRIHFDTGFHYRCWQGVGTLHGKALFSARPAILRLAQIEEADPEYLACIADGEPARP